MKFKGMRLEAILYILLVIMLLAGCSDADQDRNANNNALEVERLDGEDADEKDGFDAERAPAADENSDDGAVDQDVMHMAFDIHDLDFTNLRSEVNSLDEIFRLDDALYRASQISEALESFRVLTETVQDNIPQDTLDEIGNTGWLEQYLGFHNWTSTVEGALMKQEFHIKMLELELAIKQFQLGEIDRTSLDSIQIEFEAAKESFQLFLDSYYIAD